MNLPWIRSLAAPDLTANLTESPTTNTADARQREATIRMRHEAEGFFCCLAISNTAPAGL